MLWLSPFIFKPWHPIYSIRCISWYIVWQPAEPVEPLGRGDNCPNPKLCWNVHVKPNFYTQWHPPSRFFDLSPALAKNQICIYLIYNSFNTVPLSICTWILKFLVWKIEFDELDFLSNLNWIFAGYKDSKNQARTRQKIKFVKLDFLN